MGALMLLSVTPAMARTLAHVHMHQTGMHERACSTLSIYCQPESVAWLPLLPTTIAPALCRMLAE